LWYDHIKINKITGGHNISGFILRCMLWRNDRAGLRNDRTGATPLYAPDHVVFALAGVEDDDGDRSGRAQDALQHLAKRHTFERTVRVFPHQAHGPFKDVYVGYLSAGVDPVEACEELQADAAVKWAQPDYYYRCQLVPDDPYYRSTGGGNGYVQ
jgi:hypothetical protein